MKRDRKLSRKDTFYKIRLLVQSKAKVHISKGIEK